MITSPKNITTALVRLHFHWLIIMSSNMVLFVFAYNILRDYWPYAGRWVIIAGGVQLTFLAILWRTLAYNHRPDETHLLRTLGLGTYITLIRGLIISFLAGFIFSPWPPGSAAWVPGLLYIMAVILDYADGYCARIFNHITVLGGKLDMALDALGIFVLTTLAVWYGQVPLWFMSVGLIYYVFLGGTQWREWRKLPLYPIHDSFHRRISAGFLMVFLGIALAPSLSPEVVTLGGTVFALPVMVGFLRDWLVTIGHIDPASATYQRIQHGSYILIAQWLPVLMRFMLVLMMMLVYAQIAPRLDLAGDVAGWLKGFIIITTVAMGFGFLGRIPPILLVLPILLDIHFHNVQLYNGLALVCTLNLQLWGTGYFSFLPDLRQTLSRRARE